MNVEILDLALSGRKIGQIFRFGNGTASTIVRFVADDQFAADPSQAVLSVSLRAKDPAQQAAFWKDITASQFNGVAGRLPPYFQNLLPEGVFRRHLAELRGCREDDYFALLAACGSDLPGALKATPAHVSRSELAHLVTQDADALEMSVTAEPLPCGVSISGVQPKLGLIEEGGRYVARKRMGVTRIIGKLPQIDRVLLPEVEHLSLGLAAAAGVNVCEHKLVSLEKLDFAHGYTLGGSSNFLAVTRFDRKGADRIHCEDLAQALGVDPEHKYTGATYAAFGRLMMRFPESLGVKAVHELLRQIAVNELLGNFDAHLKNFCLLYVDGKTPTLSPAFDIVAWSVYYSGKGNALALYRPTDSTGGASNPPSKSLSPKSLRDFCNIVGVAEQPCVKVVKDAVAGAYDQWPALIERSTILDKQKERLLERMQAHPYGKRQAVSLRS